MPCTHVVRYNRKIALGERSDSCLYKILPNSLSVFSKRRSGSGNSDLLCGADNIWGNNTMQHLGSHIHRALACREKLLSVFPAKIFDCDLTDDHEFLQECFSHGLCSRGVAR